MKTPFTAITLFALINLNGAFAQSTWIVNSTGTGDFTSIQDAIESNQVVNGDEILVYPGTYVENLDPLGKSILIKSEDGPAQTIINGNAAGSVILIQSGEGPTTIIDGFTLTNGEAWDGGGIYIKDDPSTGAATSPIIKNCIIENNMGNGGGGGIAVRGRSTAEFYNCLVQNNQTLHYNGAGIVIFDSSPVIRFCTFRNNAAGQHAGGMGIWDNTSGPQIHNSIFWGNTPDNIRLYGGPTNIDAYYSCIEDGSGQFWFRSGCIDLDPLFATGSDSQGNLRESCLSQTTSGQSQTSPCTDTANPTALGKGTTRTDGRSDSGIADMGFHYSVPPPVLSVSNLQAGQTALIEINNATANNFSHFAWSIYGGGPTTTPFGDAMVSAPFNVTLLQTDSDGHASLNAPVPPSASGIPIWLHASDYGTRSLMNPLALVIQ